MSLLHVDTVRRVAASALAANGWKPNVFTTHWDIAGRCERPVPVELHSRPEAQLGREFVYDGRDHGSRVIMDVKCRKCPKCLRLKAMNWRNRAVAEFRSAGRTWFGTITLSPHAHQASLERARYRMHQQGIDYETLPEMERWCLRYQEAARELTKYVKRLRKESGAKIRYLLVCEQHKNGLPHFHMLVHERAGTILHRTLKDQWKYGFTYWKLLTDAKACGYVTKYLNKSAVARVRASALYGHVNESENDENHLHDSRTKPVFSTWKPGPPKPPCFATAAQYAGVVGTEQMVKESENGISTSEPVQDAPSETSRLSRIGSEEKGRSPPTPGAASARSASVASGATATGSQAGEPQASSALTCPSIRARGGRPPGASPPAWRGGTCGGYNS